MRMILVLVTSGRRLKRARHAILGTGCLFWNQQTLEEIGFSQSMLSLCLELTSANVDTD